MPDARLAQAADLASLLKLYRAAEVSASAEPLTRAEQIWSEILSHNGVAVFVSAVDARIVATCMLITAPNLLRRLDQGLLPRPPSKRSRGPARASFLSALRLRARAQSRLRRAPPHIMADSRQVPESPVNPAIVASAKPQPAGTNSSAKL
jgi:hypothetical protein